jgi:DNA-binding transcriptional LysR family regulator
MDRLQAMTTFVRVVENGSFSGAARQLNVGQPAVSKMIAQLEDRLQVSLAFALDARPDADRSGTALLRARSPRDRGGKRGRAGSARGGRRLSGRLRVSAATTFARLHVVPHLPAFLKANPDLEIDVILDDRVIDLVAEGVDMALRMGELPDSAAVARKLASSRRSVIATPAYLERCGIPQTPAELGSHQALIYSQASSGWTFKRGSAETSVSVYGRVRVSAAEGLRAAVLADMGLTIASDWMFSPELESGAVRRVLEAWALPTIDLWAVFPTGRLASAKARTFATFVEEVLAH